MAMLLPTLYKVSLHRTIHLPTEQEQNSNTSAKKWTKLVYIIPRKLINSELTLRHFKCFIIFTKICYFYFTLLPLTTTQGDHPYADSKQLATVNGLPWNKSSSLLMVCVVVALSIGISRKETCGEWTKGVCF